MFRHASKSVIGMSQIEGKSNHGQEDRVLGFNLPSKYASLSTASWKKALKQTVASLEAAIEEELEEISHKQGSCAIITVTIGDHGYACSLGDSTAHIVYIDPDNRVSVTPINKLHLAKYEQEKAYIKQHNGIVLWDRLGGQLMVSRAFGDCEFGKSINHKPSMYKYSIESPKGGRAFIVVASDGLTDCMTLLDEEKILRQYNGRNAQVIANELVKSGVQSGSRDDISICITPINPGDDIPYVACVFDGHSGSKIASFLQKRFKHMLIHYLDAELAKQHKPAQQLAR